jgi:hypothetical protein
MKISFFLRFCVFTLSFWGGIVGSIFLLTAINAACFFPRHFWLWFLDGIRYDLLPVAVAEMLRSPVMGLLFAWLGSHDLSRSGIIRFGAACGAASYAVASVVNLASFASWDLASYLRQPVAEYIILGLPIALILLSRFFPHSRTLLAYQENPSS